MKKAIKNTHGIDAKEFEYLYTQISQLPNAGLGLFTAIDIYKGEIISLFKGEILSDSAANERATNKEDTYFINMIDGTVMDSKHVNCFAKYANDTKPNSLLNFKNNAKISLDDHDRVCLIAKKNIKAGHEIFCGYGKSYWKKHGID